MGKQYHVKCYALDSYGQGLVKFNGSIFAIPRLLPDEKATIELVYTKGGTFAKLVQIDKPSKSCMNFTAIKRGIFHAEYRDYPSKNNLWMGNTGNIIQENF